MPFLILNKFHFELYYVITVIKCLGLRSTDPMGAPKKSSVWIKNRLKKYCNFNWSENLYSKSLFVTILMEIIKNILMINFWKILPGGNVEKYLDYIL